MSMTVTSRLILLAFLVCAWMVGWSPSEAAEKVRIRAGVHQGFARIAFDWRRPVAYTAKLDGRKLTVVFPDSFTAGFAPVTRHLGDYVRSVTQSADGKSVTFLLKRDFKLDSAVYDDVVALDLRTASGAPVSKSGGNTVAVRVGEHSGYSRLVFDWTKDTTYRVNKSGETLTVEFSRNNPLNLKRLRSDPPRFISAAKSQSKKNRRVLSVKVPGKARVRHFRDGTKIVVDVIFRARPANKSVKSAKTAPPAKTKAQNKKTAKAAPARLLPKAIDPSVSQAPKQPSPKKTAQPPVQQKQAPAPEPKTATASKPAATAGKVAVSETTNGSGIELHFPWSAPVNAAAFERAGHLWVVFDSPSQQVFKPDPGLARFVGTFAQLPHDSATVYRFELKTSVAASVGRSGTVWTVRLNQGGQSRLAAEIPVRREPAAAVGPRIFLPARDLGRRIDITDPEVGDQLYVVPVGVPGAGIGKEIQFAEFVLLKSAQGVAVSPRIDRLIMTQLRTGLEVTSPGGLKLSGAVAQAGTAKQDGNVAVYQSPRAEYLFNYAAWRLADPKDYLKTKHELQAAVSTAIPAQRNKQRLKLARFFFSHGYPTDTLAVLERVAEKNADLVTDPSYLSLQGAALTLAKRYDEALKALNHDALKGYPEVQLWRGRALTGKHAWAAANEAFEDGSAVLTAFPNAPRTDFRLDWALASVRTHESRRALVQVAKAENEAASKPQRLLAMLMRAAANEDMGALQNALEGYELVAQDDYRPTQVRARLGRIRVLLAQNQLKHPEAIEALEKLRYAWRGDDLELDLMHRLGRLYIAEKDFRKGLEVMRQAVTYYPESQLAPETAKDMNEEFARLFLEGGADDLSPVTALGLFNDFRELTPMGPKGDEVIRRLADRLVGVDLLDQAGQLLEHQVNYRLKGEEKARVAARLAVIRLLDRKPADALKALRKSQWSPLPEDLAKERRRLEARSLSDLDRYDEALAALGQDDGRDGQALRAEIFWRWKKWPEAAKSFASLLGESWKSDDKLDAGTRRLVMQQAVSLSLANRYDELQILRKAYGRHVQGTPDEQAFDVITADVNHTGTNFRQLASTIAQISELETFMTSYKEKLSQGNLSAIN